MVIDWLVPALPLARIAWLRSILSVFACVDATLLTNHVLQHVHVGQFFSPGLLGRLLHVPAPTSLTAWTALVVMLAGTVAVILGRWTRAAALAVSVAYLLWLLWSMGFGYVGHDHMAIFVAMCALPTAGAAGYHELRPDHASGWAIRVIQIATVATYFGSAISKWSRSGTPWAWANGAVFVWALLRRGSPLMSWLVHFPALLMVGQWGLLLLEFLSPVVLWLRGRLLAAAVTVFLLFHLMTFLALGIHFLPTAVCWLAFAPLEKLSAPLDRLRAGVRRGRRHRRARATAAG